MRMFIIKALVIEKMCVSLCTECILICLHYRYVYVPCGGQKTFPVRLPYYAPVLCNHCPQNWGIVGTSTFCPAKPCCWDSQLVKPTPFSPAVYVFITLPFLPIPDNSHSLWGQCKSKNTAHFHDYPPPSPGAGAWLQMTSALAQQSGSK